MKKIMRNAVVFIIAAIASAMLSAGVYAAPAVEVAYTEEPSVPPDTPPEGNIAVDGDKFPDIAVTGAEPTRNDIAFEEPIFDEEYLPDEVVVPDDVPPVEPLPELGDINKYLAQNGYPSYLSFICNTAAAINGYDPSSGEEYKPKMTYWWDVGVVNATAAQKAEIRAIIDELYPIENIINFVNCTYSHAAREAMVPEIRETVEKLFPEIKVIDVSLIRNTEQIALQLDFSADGDVPEPDMVREKMYAVYGDLLYMGDFGVTTDDSHDVDLPTVGITEIGAVTASAEIDEIDEVEVDVEEEIGVASNEDGLPAATWAATSEESGPIQEVIDENGEPADPIGGDVDSAPIAGEMIAVTADPAQPNANNTVLWICIAAVLVIALGTVAFIYRGKLIPVFATSNGDAAAKSASKKQTEEAVKNSEIVPGDSVLQAIKEKIDE